MLFMSIYLQQNLAQVNLSWRNLRLCVLFFTLYRSVWLTPGTHPSWFTCIPLSLVSLLRLINSLLMNSVDFTSHYRVICIQMVYGLGMGDYENMSQWLLSVQVSRLLRLLATLHMYVDFIQQSNWYLLFVE